MKKIGFIDYYLDEWHANNYPEMIRNECGDEMQVCYAYGKIDSPIGGMTNREWAEKYHIELQPSIDVLIEKSDFIIVLSPDNPEMHEELSEAALKSGKRVYIDKTFANDTATAKRMFDLAEEKATKMFTSSALNYSDELRATDKDGISNVNSRGGGLLEMYCIHQIEPVVVLMGNRPRRAMFTGSEEFPAYTVEFDNGRYAHISQLGGDFAMDIAYGVGEIKQFTVKSDYFGNFISALVEFFRTGEPPVCKEQTMTVIAVREAVIKAKEKPFSWVDIEC